MAQVFDLIFVLLCHFSNIDLSCWMVSSTVFLIVFIFFQDLSLRLIISKKGIVGLSFVFVLIPILVLPIGVVLVFFNRQPIRFQAPKVDLSNLERWLQAGLCFHINSLLYYFISRIQVLFLIV